MKRSTFAVSVPLLAAFMSVSTQSVAASCPVRARLAESLANARDRGVSLAETRKLLNKVDTSADEKTYAQNMAVLVYKDFPNKTANEISTLIQVICESE